MNKWIHTKLRPAIGDLMRKCPKLYDAYQKVFFYFVGKKKWRGMHRVGYQYSKDIQQALDKTGIRYFAAYGTMLGLVREGGFIGHDEDIDFGVLLDEQFSWEKLESCMSSIGFRKKHIFTCNGVITEQTYMKNGLSVDFFSFEEEGDTMITYYYIKEKDKEYKKNEWTVCYHRNAVFEGFQKINCHDVEFQIPLNPEKYLEEVYGTGWKIPDPNYVGKHKILEDAEGYILKIYK